MQSTLQHHNWLDFTAGRKCNQPETSTSFCLIIDKQSTVHVLCSTVLVDVSAKVHFVQFFLLVFRIFFHHSKLERLGDKWVWLCKTWKCYSTFYLGYDVFSLLQRNHPTNLHFLRECYAMSCAHEAWNVSACIIIMLKIQIHNVSIIIILHFSLYHYTEFSLWKKKGNIIVKRT